MDLSVIPVGAREMELLVLENLEQLELDRTGITDADLLYGKNLSKLKILKLYTTAISDQSILGLHAMENLKKVFLWDTKIRESGPAKLKTDRPKLHMDAGLGKELDIWVIKIDSIY